MILVPGNANGVLLKLKFTKRQTCEEIFACWNRRQHLLVASDFGRCFEIKFAVIPGQVVKFSSFMERRKVDVMGLKYVPCKNDARSDFVWLLLMVLHTVWF